MSEEQLKVIQIKEKKYKYWSLKPPSYKAEHYSGLCIYVLLILMRKEAKNWQIMFLF